MAGGGFPEWVIGVILIIIGSLGNNLGNNLVSLGHQQAQQKSIAEAAKPALEVDKVEAGAKGEEGEEGGEEGEEGGEEGGEEEKETNWRVIGTTIFVLGNLFTFGAFGFGAQSLIAALESIQFVSNVVFAKYVHKELITRRMLASTLSIIGGNVLVIIYSSHSSALINSDEMIYLYKTNTAYHVYMIAAFLLWAATSFIFRKYHHSRTVLRAPLLFRHSFLEPFCYAVSSAIIGTQAVLNSKCMSILIQVSIRERNEFNRWFLYFVLATWILLVAYWLKRLDWGLELFPPLFIIPVMQVFFVLFAILCGGIYFKEFSEFEIDGYIGFVAGVCMILTGVYGLAPLDMVLYIPDLPNAAEEAEGQNGEAGNSISDAPGSPMGGTKSGAPPSSEKKRLEALNSRTLESKIAKSLPFFDDYFMEVHASSPDANLSKEVRHKPKPDQGSIAAALTLPPMGRGKVYLEPLNAPSMDGASPETPSSRKSNRRVVNRSNLATTPTAAAAGSAAGSTPAAGTYTAVQDKDPVGTGTRPTTRESDTGTEPNA